LKANSFRGHSRRPFLKTFWVILLLSTFPISSKSTVTVFPFLKSFIHRKTLRLLSIVILINLPKIKFLSIYWKMLLQPISKNLQLISHLLSIVTTKKQWSLINVLCSYNFGKCLSKQLKYKTLNWSVVHTWTKRSNRFDELLDDSRRKFYFT